ncbi:VPLPA-CTERM sorting domain-containing protein [Thermosulfurimonas sp. F29]|uniref:VPLPA-CTERM sorting domain-containing protein n=1 Tax=Thermosulfurimonas sp. F29 TaxID=2867247 RepID=UPI001C83666E|nr:VPLPA-CTERM sorting domain-containing protein [Thermosulfurimonas sp. F29]MBX6423201.1 VPLPA-CTERM sorting domain-containing protein [Thermosulfurimonas sp. F29]
MVIRRLCLGKGVRVFLLAVVLVLAGAVWGRAAVVNGASAYISLDWSRAEIQGIDVGDGVPTISSWSNLNQEAEAYAGEISSSNSSKDWSTPLDVSASAPGASAEVELSENIMSATASALGNNAFGDGERYGSFTVNGTGILLFKVPFHWEMTNVKGGWTSVWAWGGVWRDQSEESGYYSDTSINIYHDDVGQWSEDGWLVLSSYFNDGDVGHISIGIGASASSPVPLPAGVWLLGAGLAGLGIAERRRRRLRS